MRDFVKLFVETYDVCQKHNYSNEFPRGFLNSVKDKMTLEIMGLNLNKSYPSERQLRRYYQEIVDYFSKWV